MGKDTPGKGILFVVSTPIGNLDDITIRALETLRRVSLIAAEDTRRTRKLLSRFDIHTPLMSYFEHNEVKRLDKLLAHLKRGKEIALVSDAGTPAISDPGYRLIQKVIEQGIPVAPIPGPSAVIAALSVSGLPTDRFSFVGFLPRKGSKRGKLLDKLADSDATIRMLHRFSTNLLIASSERWGTCWRSAETGRLSSRVN